MIVFRDFVLGNLVYGLRIYIFVRVFLSDLNCRRFENFILRNAYRYWRMFEID